MSLLLRLLLLLLLLIVLISATYNDDLLDVVKSNPSIDNIYRLGNYYLYYHKNCIENLVYDFDIDNKLNNIFLYRLNTWNHDNSNNSIECKSRTLLCYSLVLYLKRLMEGNHDIINSFDYSGMLNDLGILYSSIDMYSYAIDAYEEALNGITLYFFIIY